jgi:hypothetical protein
MSTAVVCNSAVSGIMVKVHAKIAAAPANSVRRHAQVIDPSNPQGYPACVVHESVLA